ncbi:hypothetical protein M2305_003265 [Gluconobacter cerinus]|nr:hypothetical protein [Gluconobacter cerinus]
MIELLKICDVHKPTMCHMWYESTHFAVRYDTRVSDYTGMIIGTHNCTFIPSTYIIDHESLLPTKQRNGELCDFLYENSDVSKWTEELIFYMVMKFEIERK